MFGVSRSGESADEGGVMRGDVLLLLVVVVEDGATDDKAWHSRGGVVIALDTELEQQHPMMWGCVLWWLDKLVSQGNP